MKFEIWNLLARFRYSLAHALTYTCTHAHTFAQIAHFRNFYQLDAVRQKKNQIPLSRQGTHNYVLLVCCYHHSDIPSLSGGCFFCTPVCDSVNGLSDFVRFRFDSSRVDKILRFRWMLPVHAYVSGCPANPVVFLCVINNFENLI